MMPDYRVIWDGRKQSGPYLFCDQHAVIGAARPESVDNLTQRARLLRSSMPDWFTAAELAVKLETRGDRAGSVIQSYIKQGEMEREAAGLFRGRRTGAVQRYRWVSR